MYVYNFAFPNTYLGDVNLSRKTQTEIDQFLTTRSLDSVDIEVNTRIYSFSYEDLGILFYKEKALSEIFEPNQHPFFRYAKFLSASSTERIIPPPLTFSQDFYEMLDAAEFTFIDPQSNEGKTYVIDAETLKTQLALNFGKKEPIEVTLLEKTEEEKDPSVMARRLNHVQDKPVDLIVTDGDKSSNVSFSKAEVKGVSTVRMDPETADVHISVDKEKLSEIIREKNEDLAPVQSDIVQEDIRNDFTALIDKRLDGQNSDVIVTRLADKANTTGDRAEKYIEVDLSQKKLYLFDGGRVTASFPVMSDVCQAAEAGEYSVRTRAKSAYSASTHRWVPYWVAFSLHEETNALLGINEVPYAKEDTDSAPRINPNKVKTESCISLPIGRAQEVYAFASVNMPVYVFE
jgi:hypothetical protein